MQDAAQDLGLRPPSGQTFVPGQEVPGSRGAGSRSVKTGAIAAGVVVGVIVAGLLAAFLYFKRNPASAGAARSSMEGATNWFQQRSTEVGETTRSSVSSASTWMRSKYEVRRSAACCFKLGSDSR